ncbi:hypothetical protein [Noviherbaspirillum massiliense]|uniref:hypothetical protein n=1 Tax=Noviherbaspirillum massiliense TaxID=1465823 RepID=UPI00031AF1BD|nr:hypothetical protein [Noviherbaspirillum massiliense]
MTAKDSKLKQKEVRTKGPVPGVTAPRMPHERDESVDRTGGDPVRRDIKQAYDDLQNGQVDTDLRETHGVDAVVNDVPENLQDRIVKRTSLGGDKKKK